MKLLVFLFDVFGRVRRRDFLLYLLALTAFYAVSFMPAMAQHERDMAGFVQAWLGTDWRFILFVVVQLATMCVVIKRCHDRDMSGLWTLSLLVPVLGWIWFGYELCIKEGTEGANRFGPSPKGGYRSLW